ncbi:FYVE, RhoGEF and PH domain-containing protein 3 [Trichinella spiralis]|uniref:FYVE, RhoGEF and PH domain-containing protein 3 n=1 Tax=Trichinella spiralis TaxID=6334 RepID=UPI0001EFB9D5|nr:FYVE, RhoGEF and PH domain-containing protein 3 [Trichinella spiralis]
MGTRGQFCKISIFQDCLLHVQKAYRTRKFQRSAHTGSEEQSSVCQFGIYLRFSQAAFFTATAKSPARMVNWNLSLVVLPREQKISDVVCQQAPFLKMYSEYINNYKRATKVFEELYKKGGKFAQIVDEVERMPECENLSLVSHIIGPVQRVMRYHLLMQVLLMQNCDIRKNTLVGLISDTHHKYLKHLPENHCDRQDTEKALELVKSAASHANEIMRKLDKYKDLVELQEQLGCQVIELVSPSRELIKQGRLLKLSSKSDEQQTRHLNDMLLVCSERKVPIHKYKLRSLLEISGMTVLEGDYLDIENTFYVRTKRKVIAFCAGTFKEKAEWMESLWSTIRELAAQRQSFRMSGRVRVVEKNSPNWTTACRGRRVHCAPALLAYFVGNTLARHVER